jgi:hypothetical protein
MCMSANSFKRTTTTNTPTFISVSQFVRDTLRKGKTTVALLQEQIERASGYRKYPPAASIRRIISNLRKSGYDNVVTSREYGRTYHQIVNRD